MFHYCQDGARHSWVCPEGFTFHQVHLICMPPSSDNNCQKSSSFFFVNEYLYRPVNEEEVLRKPNVSLRYSDRYYPQNYYADGEEGVPQQQQLQSQVVPQRVPLQQGLPQQQHQQQAPRRASPAPVQYQPTPRPSAPVLQTAYRQSSPSNQVSLSPAWNRLNQDNRHPAACKPQAQVTDALIRPGIPLAGGGQHPPAAEETRGDDGPELPAHGRVGRV